MLRSHHTCPTTIADSSKSSAPARLAAMSVDLSTLLAFEPFSSLSDLDQAGLAASASLRVFEPQHRVLEPLSVPQAVFIVLSGQLQIVDETEDGRTSIVGFVNAGGMVGWLSAVDGQASPYAIIAQQESTLLTIPIGIARSLLEKPSVNSFLLRQFAASIRQQVSERRILCMPNAFQRVFFLLLNQIGKLPKQGQALPKQQDIAVMVNTSRETVSRAFQILIKQGVATKEGHRIVINDTQKLAKYAYDGLPENVKANPTSTQDAK